MGKPSWDFLESNRAILFGSKIKAKKGWKYMGTLSWIFLYLILPLGLGVLGNFATPWVKSFFEKGSITLKQRRINALLDDYKRIKRYREDNQLFSLNLATIIILFMLGCVITLSDLTFMVCALIYASYMQVLLDKKLPVGFAMVFLALAILLGMGAFGISSAIERLLRMGHVPNFDSYKEKTIKELIELGGNPEDLGKEEANKPVKEESKPLKINKKKVG